MKKSAKQTIGWREWVALPELGIPAIKVKVDTGARSSAIHAFKIESFEREGQLRVRFAIHPIQRRKDVIIYCEADLIDQRDVTSSSGQKERRYVIRTKLQLGERTWPIEITLTNRDNMNFRMLLGRTAIRNRCLVHPGTSYQTGKNLADVYPKRKK